MNEKITNILFAGVGGQGIILAGKILAQTALESGFDVRANELHGMAQRGGSVVSHIRFGKEVHSPLIPRGETDIFLAMEGLEALRYGDFLSPKCKIIFNARKILPAGTVQENYPADIKKQLEIMCFDVIEIDALKTAQDIGSQKIENIVLLGTLSKYLPFSETEWENVIKKSVPQKTIDMNLAGFKTGRGAN